MVAIEMFAGFLSGAFRPFPYFRGRQRVLNAITPRVGTRVVKVHGTPIRLSLSEYIDRNVYMGSYEPEETAIVRRLLRPGATFVDAGANIGYFTAVASRAVGVSGRVLAIEPMPQLFARLSGDGCRWNRDPGICGENDKGKLRSLIEFRNHC